jgi:hypothetical protein
MASTLSGVAATTYYQLLTPNCPFARAYKGILIAAHHTLNKVEKVLEKQRRDGKSALLAGAR